MERPACRCLTRRSPSRKSDAILFGCRRRATQIIHADRSKRPGAGILKLRKSLGLFANFRPAVMFPEMLSASSCARKSCGTWTC